MPTKPQELYWSDETIEKLAAHGLTIADVFAVFERAPVFIVQESRDAGNSFKTSEERPRRVRMIGPGRTDAILTVILEYPDSQDNSNIVTAFDSPRHDLDAYVQRRRQNR